MSKYNVDLMLAVRDQITMFPETHKQSVWGRQTQCGTTHCIAGWTASLDGAKLDWLRDGECETVNGRRTSIRGYATIALGLTEEERDALFFEIDHERALAKLDALIEKGKNQT